MKRMILMLLGLSASLTFSETEWRTFTDAKGERTLEARIAEKKPDNSKIRLVLKKGGTKWIDSSKFSKADQKYISEWEHRELKVRANTVSTARSTGSWTATWGNFDAKGAEVISERVGRDYKSRIIGLEVENKGSVEDFIMEVYWLGFQSRDKGSRKITALAAQPIKIPAGGDRHKIRVGSTFNKIDENLRYQNADETPWDWKRWYVRSWWGYLYAGWAIRISDGDGIVIKEVASQPSFLKHISTVPVPFFEGEFEKE